MRRLHHSSAGFLRSLQISRKSVFCFVEGKEIDSFFYSELCQCVCESHAKSYQVKRAREISQHAGGKIALLDFYRYLKRRKKLSSTFHGKKTLILFFLDKDIDDVLRKLCRSPHIIYTRYYDVQNHLFVHGNLLKAISVAASLDKQEVNSFLEAYGNWCESAAQRWKDWIVFCIFCQIHGLQNANYRITSRINSPINGPVDVCLYNNAIDEARKSLGWSEDKMTKTLASVRRRVEKHFNTKEQDAIFKGKWYTTILEQDLRDNFQGQDIAISGVSQRILSALAATIDFSQEWSNNFTSSIDHVIRQNLL